MTPTVVRRGWHAVRQQIGRRHTMLTLAIVTPLLKKPELDADELKNYRPVSNLTFVSKLVERVVASRLVSYLRLYFKRDSLDTIDCTQQLTT